MDTELSEKAHIVLDLLKSGAEEVSIIGTDISVRRINKSNGDNYRGDYKISIVNNNVTNVTQNVSVSISLIKEELKQIYGNGKRFSELNEKIDEIEPELKKKHPDKTKLKSFIHWLADFGWKAFEKVMPLLLEKLINPT